MKNLLALVVVLSISMLSFAQKQTEANVKGNAQTIKASVTSGVFEFKLPAGTTEAAVEKNKAYYTSYFTVDYIPGVQMAKITMTDNTSAARRVIVRFLVSNNVRKVNFDGKQYSVSEFYENFLK